MIIQKKHKPSFHRANARYRGVTEHGQYTNFALETAHDLLLLSDITTGNEATSRQGHENEMRDNFLSVMAGDAEVGRTNIFTASTLQKIDETRTIAAPDLLNWSSLNGATVAQNGPSFIVETAGLHREDGLFTTLYVEPGDHIYMRLKVKSANGAPAFSFGSLNIRTGPDTVGNTKKYDVPADSDFITLDYIMDCKYAEAISLNINTHEAAESLAPVKIEIKDVEIHYLNETPVEVSSFHLGIKPSIDEVEEKINSIR